MARGVQDGLRVLVHNQIRGEAARQIAGDIGCAKLPIEICGAGCTFEEGSEERHDETIATLVEVPETSAHRGPAGL